MQGCVSISELPHIKAKTPDQSTFLSVLPCRHTQRPILKAQETIQVFMGPRTVGAVSDAEGLDQLTVPEPERQLHQLQIDTANAISP
jgi:hypothetical protein